MQRIGFLLSAEDARTPQELAEAARRDKERLGPLASQKAKLLEGLTLEQVYARWAEVMGPGVEWASLDDFKLEVLAMYQTVGSKAGKRVESLRAGGFDINEPMQ